MDIHTDDLFSSKSLVPKATAPPLISHVAFHAIIWTGVSLCVLAFSGRLAIRVICFRRLFPEDYAMLLSLIILVGTAIIIQILVPYCYNIKNVHNGYIPLDPQFIEDTVKGLRGHVALMVMNYVGIWLIKISFLIFLFRLGDKVTKYRVLWWIVLAFNIAAGVTAIGIIPFECLLSPVERIVAKVVLTALFSLVVFTVLVTIVRGSVFSGAYISIDQPDVQPVNVAWLWFWFSIEYIISFIVACLISFRCLFTQIESDASVREARAPQWCHQAPPVSRLQPQGLREKARIFRKSMRDTLMTLEGFTRIDSEVFALPSPPTGRLSLNFEEDGESNRT
ncbi:uncharacterized protein F4807DRAFT_469071 [Annulohypoxylon truncatum]|uniref:uncharacterized protein n=1 Tax=Annulohypoxylon truncatum TaxID=327061 RepID=UPI002008BCCD|nr:uncharacterized protein F4807DRAFT_469071 [Annulohypoxylon truncatum]KAI1207856.1 hypothetical protein F4807DRAFT_469071 [Annulohypoxylon truncatum]